MMKLVSVGVLMGTAVCGANPIPVSPRMFRDPEFVKTFVGSYGFLSPVEPKVDAEEAQLLVELQELFAKGSFREVESKLVNFIQERKNPIDPEAQPKDVSPAMIFMLGNYYFQNDRIGEAERAYKIAIEKFPKFRRAYKNLAMLYASKGEMEMAEPNLRQAIQLGDGDHRSFGLLGYAYLLKKKPVAAEGAYRQAYLLNADEKDWKLGLAQALLLQEKWPEAASLLGELIDETPDNPDLWKRQANCFIEMGEKMRAAANFEILRRMELADVETLDLLGNIYMDQEQPMLALGAYLAAMKASQSVDAMRALRTARILVDFGASMEAVKYLEEVRTLGGQTLQKDDRIGLLLVEVDAARARGNTGEIGALLEKILEMDAGNGQALVQRGMYLEELGQDEADPDLQSQYYAKARTSFRLALDKPEVAYQANLRYGQMLVRQRQFIESLVYLKQALSLQKSDSLTEYVRRVERAAERQKEREEREAEERAKAEAEAREATKEEKAQ